MKLNELQPAVGATKSPKRVGRGIGSSKKRAEQDAARAALEALYS